MQQAWQEHNFSVEWAKEAGLDSRGLRFARDVRRQLEGITGPQGSHLLGTHIGLHQVVTPVCLPHREPGPQSGQLFRDKNTLLLAMTSSLYSC
jgi:hypothetical protein